MRNDSDVKPSAAVTLLCTLPIHFEYTLYVLAEFFEGHDYCLLVCQVSMRGPPKEVA